MSGKGGKGVYMAVTADKYELPICLADTVVELARMCGTSENTIYSQISHRKHGKIINCGLRTGQKYLRVEIDEGKNLSIEKEKHK